jgi:hypothetical protein
MADIASSCAGKVIHNSARAVPKGWLRNGMFRVILGESKTRHIGIGSKSRFQKWIARLFTSYSQG